MAKFDVQAYARRGAEVRLAELKAELDAIYEAFPDLAGRRGRGKGAPSASLSYTDDGQTILPDAPVARKRRRRKPLTAAQRKAIGERMRKYWAARKKANQ